MKDYNKLYQVSRSYAQALFESTTADKLDLIYNQFILINDIFSDPEIANLLGGENLPSEYTDILMRVIEEKVKPDKLLKNLLGLLIKNNRLMALTKIFECFNKLVLKTQNKKDLIIIVADQESTKFIPKIVERLEQLLKIKFFVEVKINSNLLSGFTLQIDSMLFDASLDNTLKRYQKNILKQISVI